MQAWWIISLLGDTEAPRSARTLENVGRHLRAWSAFAGVTPTWWCAESFPVPRTAVSDDLEALLSHALGVLRNPFHASERGGIANVDPTWLNVLLLGDVRAAATRAFLTPFAIALRSQAKRLLPGTEVQCLPLIHVPSTATNDTADAEWRGFLDEVEALTLVGPARRPFDGALVLQDRNAGVSNRAGYPPIADETLESLFTQVACHLATAGDHALKELKRLGKGKLVACGAAAVFLDRTALLDDASLAVAARVLDRTTAGDIPPFVDAADVGFRVCELGRPFAVDALARSLILGAERPSFEIAPGLLEGARDGSGRPVSPWAMVSRALLTVYFSRYIGGLAARIETYARIFLRASLQQFDAFLAARGRELWDGDSGLRAGLRDGLAAVLRPDAGSPRTVAQLRLVAAGVGDALTSSGTAGEWPTVPVFTVPNLLKPHYERAQASLSAAEERRLLDRVAVIARFHPLPAALLLRASVLSVLLIAAAVPVLRAISPSLVDASALLRHPTLVRLVAGLLPLALAWWRYEIRVLRALRRRVLEYLAAVLKHAEGLASKRTVAAAEALRAEARRTCGDVMTWAEALHGTPLPTISRESFAAAAFCLDLRGGGTVPSRTDIAPAAPVAPVVSVRLPVDKTGVNALSDGQVLALGQHWLDCADAEGRRVYALLGGSLPPGPESPRGALVGLLLAECHDRCELPGEGRLRALWNQDWAGLVRTLSGPALVPAGHVAVQGPMVEWAGGEAPHLPHLAAAELKTSTECGELVSCAGFSPLDSMDDLAVVAGLAPVATSELTVARVLRAVVAEEKLPGAADRVAAARKLLGLPESSAAAEGPESPAADAGERLEEV